MATVIRQATCPACGHGAAEWREAKAGAASFHCPECKFGGFAKSPKAAAAVRAGGTPKMEPTMDGVRDGSEPALPVPKKGGFLDDL